ncbi:MAG: hypothetical protein AB7O04_12520, partial [Hyphomonadaceae bacterium]
DELIGIGGKVEANIYYCIVEVPALSLRKPMALYSPIDHDVPAMVLLGRDFLSDFVLVYEGPEQAFSFFRAGQHPDDYADGDDG